MQHLLHFFQTYGYWVMLFGSLIEGESFLVAGGIAAHQGLFSIPILIGMAFVGSCIHDFFFFFIGRYAGDHILIKFKSAKDKSAKVLALFDRYGVLIILCLRFAYGFRTVIPIVIGMSPISKRKFILFDMIGGIIWATLFILAGYFFGAAIHVFLSDINMFEAIAFRVIVVLAVLAVVGFFLWWLLVKRQQKS